MTTVKGQDFVGETSAGIQFKVDVAAQASVSIVRDGKTVTQNVVPVQAQHIQPGAKLLHRIDGKVYSVVKFENNTVYLVGPTGEESDGTLKQVKNVFWGVVESTG